MREFFKPWRRKVGLVTLGMAFAFAGLLVRSVETQDTITIALSKSSHIHVLSANQHFVVLTIFDETYTMKFWGSNEINHGGPTRRGWEIFTDASYFSSDFIPDFQLKLTRTTDANCDERFAISYWFIVTPLTLLSVWMLLNKPRPAKPIVPPDPDHV